MNPLWHLGNTTDARLLVPGDPEALREDADDLDAAAIRLDALSEDARAGTETPSWGGWAHEQWGRRRADLLTVPSTVGEVYRGAAGALRAHADVVAWAQTGATTAIDLWAHGVERSRAAGVLWIADPPGTGDTTTDPGAAHRLAAIGVLDRCHAVATDSALALAQLLDQLTDGMPDGKLHGRQFFAGVADWALGIIDMMWRLHAVRAAVDHDGWLGDLRSEWDAAAGVYRLVTDDPLHAGPVLADTEGLRDNPAYWLGILIPEIALTKGRGPGVAGRALTAAQRLEHIPRRTHDWPEQPEPGTWEYLLGWDPEPKKFRLNEYRTAVRIIEERGVHLEREPLGARADWRDSEGTTYDAMGGYDGRHLNDDDRWEQLFSQIDRHLEKADLVPIDVSGFDADQIARIKAYIEPMEHRYFLVGEL